MIDDFEKAIKKIILALVALIMVGCDDICDKIENQRKKATQKRIERLSILVEWHNSTVIIDSCEYICEETRGLVEHKGNCRFCAERRKQELEELVEQLKGK